MAKTAHNLAWGAYNLETSNAMWLLYLHFSCTESYTLVASTSAELEAIAPTPVRISPYMQYIAACALPPSHAHIQTLNRSYMD